MIGRWSFSLFGGAVLLAAPAHAQEAMGAEVLFNEGVALMKSENFSEGCPKIEESQRLEPRPGTLFTLAECRAKEGKIATAVARYEEYLRVFARMSDDAKRKQRGREKIAEQKRDELRPQVPKLKVALPAGAPRAARVEKDGIELGRASLETWLPVDPGEHRFVVKTASGNRKESRITLGAGERRELVLELPPAEPASSGGTPTPPASAETDGRADRGASEDDTLAWVALGIGGAGIVVSAITGALALSKKSTIDEHCNIGGDETACDAEGKAAADSANTLALVSTVSFVVGVVGIGTGTVLMIDAGNDATGRHAAVNLTGRW